MANAGTRRYFLTDNLGSVVATTDNAGALTSSYSYDPYGNTRTATGTAAADNPLRFTGGYLDRTGLTKLGARYYDPTLGRFTQTNPTGQDPHYTYARNNPVNYVDPTGALGVPDVLGTAGAAVGAAAGIATVAAVCSTGVGCVALAAVAGASYGAAGGAVGAAAGGGTRQQRRDDFLLGGLGGLGAPFAFTG